MQVREIRMRYRYSKRNNYNTWSWVNYMGLNIWIRRILSGLVSTSTFDTLYCSSFAFRLLKIDKVHSIKKDKH